MSLFQITGITTSNTLFGSSSNSYANVVGVLVSRGILFAISISGFFYLYRLILAGFNYMNSFGDAGKIDSAHKELLNATMGLVIVISAFFISQIIEAVFGLNFV